MYEGLSKIYWGVILMILDINIGFFDILPDFIGAWLLITGISCLYDETKVKEFYNARVFAIIIFIESIVGVFYRANLTNEGTHWILALGVVAQLVILMMVFFICSGIIIFLENKGFEVLAKTMMKVRRNYVFIVGGITFAMTLIPNMRKSSIESLILGGAIIVFVMNVIFVYQIWELRGNYEEKEGKSN